MAAKPLPVIFDYLDHVKYLRDYYEARHEADRWFSYRYIQQRTGIDPGYLFKVFQGKKSLPQKKTASLAATLGLSRRETEYFNLLVLYNKAKTNEAIRLYFEKLLSYKEIALRKIEVQEYDYYAHWYNAAVRQILSYYPFSGDYGELASLTVPAITPAEAKRAVELLLKLGLAKKGENNTVTVTDRFLTTGAQWHTIAVRKFQQDTIDLARSSLDTVDKEVRDISTVTVTLSNEGFIEAKERIRQFRRDLLDLAGRQEQPSGAYHLNLQLIPIGRSTKGRKS